ncbi:efflux RND transporter permease subunit [Cupriavidus basilensis]
MGLLIDDAIVVRENIVRHSLMGKDHRTSALDGTAEIGLAVLATTFSIVAVFLPVEFHGRHHRALASTSSASPWLLPC